MKVLDGFPSMAPEGSLKIFAVERETRVPVWIPPKSWKGMWSHTYWSCLLGTHLQNGNHGTSLTMLLKGISESKHGKCLEWGHEWSKCSLTTIHLYLLILGLSIRLLWLHFFKYFQYVFFSLPLSLPFPVCVCLGQQLCSFPEFWVYFRYEKWGYYIIDHATLSSYG